MRSRRGTRTKCDARVHGVSAILASHALGRDAPNRRENIRTPWPQGTYKNTLRGCPKPPAR
jgi:hypothetical protein